MNEWLEADGLGGFASGTAGLIRTRRYHALLLAATKPPAGRYVLVNGFDAWVETPSGRYAISSQRYSDETVHPDGAQRISAFQHQPWPRWTFDLEDGTRVEQELLVEKDAPLALLHWRLPQGTDGTTLIVRPFLSGRDYHSLHHENPALRQDALVEGPAVTWQTYDDLPAVSALSNGDYRHDPHWYRSFLYTEERERGLDHVEDLWSPGELVFDLGAGEAVLAFSTSEHARLALAPFGDAAGLANRLREAERQRRAAFRSSLQRAADAYLVRRGGGLTVMAGYPWFTDWGRDTFIALRGLCLATGRYAEARGVLLEWAGAVSQGMLPNRFQDQGDEPEYNAADASLWYVVVVHELLEAAAASRCELPTAERERLVAAVLAILEGYANGARYGIRMDADGLLLAGEPGVQLTWMDAKVGDWVVTPRIGKPVEVQALWLNALRIGARFAPKWNEVFLRASASFAERFWNEAGGGLYDVVDDGGVARADDGRCRPNQLFAVGGLPFQLVEGERARRIVDTVEARLLTPLGPRSLAREEEGYAPRYEGGVRERDGAYHQGTVWPWLIGPFVEAWVRVRENARAARQEARERFLAPLLRHQQEAGLGHISEIADGDAPHLPRGCPFQAWSVGEALRLELSVLADPLPATTAGTSGGRGPVA